MTGTTDESLPTLATAVSPEGMVAVWRATSTTGRAFPDSNSSVSIVKYVAGKRATLLYSFHGQTEASKQVVGKLYRSRRRAARMHGWLVALNRSVFPETAPLRVPRPAGLSMDLRMVLHEYIDGEDIRNVLEQAEPFAFAGRWLARLHEAAPLEELKIRTVQHEAQKALDWLDAARDHASPDLQARLDEARRRLAALIVPPPGAELCMIHRDFYYANVLWDGTRLWAIDLDQLRIGDPALDVAHFIAHLEVLSYRQTGDFTSYAGQAERFLAAYRAERPAADVDRRLPLYSAYTFLKLASTEADRARPGWHLQNSAFAERACASLERLV